MHIADGVIWDCFLRFTRIMTLRGCFKSHSEIAALFSASGGFSYLMYQLQHYLVRWVALVTWWFRVGSRNLCTSQYTVLCTMWYTVKFTVYCVVYSTVYCWFAHSPPKTRHFSALDALFLQKHFLVLWMACLVSTLNLCISQYTVLCTMRYTVKFTVYCVVYSTVYRWLAHSPPNRCRLHRRWHV